MVQDNSVLIHVAGEASQWEPTARAVKTDIKEVDTATGKLQASFASLQSTMFELGKISSFTLMVKQTIDAALQMERLQKLFNAAAGSANLAGREIEYVKGVANKMGLDFLTTAESYGKFMAAVRNTTLEGEKGRKVFESVSGAATALGLSSDETKGIFNALQQMMSKGKVQAEELRGQLGERLPGAFKMAADAMGVTTAQLDKMMVDGKLLADDLLPKLAVQLDKTYGKATMEGAKGAQAEINRMNNAMFEAKAVAGAALIPVFTDIVKGITPLFDILKSFVAGIQILSVKTAALPDRMAAIWQVIKSGKGIFSKEGMDMYAGLRAGIDKNEADAIDDAMKKYMLKGSDYTNAELLRQKGITPSKGLDKDKEAESALKHLISAQKTWDQEALLSGKVTEELGAKLAALRDKYDKLNKETEKATGSKATAAREQIKADMAIIQANMIAADIKKGQKELDDAMSAQSLSTFKNNLQTEKSALEAALADRSITRAEYFAGTMAMIEKESAKELSDLKIKLTKEKALRDAYDPFDDDQYGAWLSKSADIAKTETTINDVIAKRGDLINNATKSNSDYLKQEETRIQSLKKSLQEQKNSVDAMKAAHTGTDPATGQITDPTANAMAVANQAWENEQRIFDQRRDAILSEYELKEQTAANYEEMQKRLYGNDAEQIEKRIQAQIALNAITASAEKEKYDQLVGFAQKAFPKITSFQTAANLLTVKYHNETIKNAKGEQTSFEGATRDKMQMVGAYTAFAGQALSDLAASQDQSTRAGFESAKAYSLGAAVMSTAAAIMQQLAGPDGWTPVAWARAAIAGVLGAVQIAQIASTSYGGGGSSSFSVPSGTFATGGATGTGSTSGIGASVGGQSRTADELMSSKQLDDISASLGDSALALSKISDNLFKLSDYLETGFGKGLVTNIPGADLGGFKAEAPKLGKMLMTDILTGSLGAIPITQWVMSAFQSENIVKNSGVSIGFENGSATAKGWLSREVGNRISGSKRRREEYDIDPEYKKALDNVIGMMQTSYKKQAMALGMSAQDFEAATRNVQIKAQDLDRNDSKYGEKLMALLTNFGDQQIAAAMPDLRQYALPGGFETDSQVLERLSTSASTVAEAFALIDKPMMKASKETANYAFLLVDLFEGADKFKESMDTYRNAMYTEEEIKKQDTRAAQNNVNELGLKLEKLGYTLPATREGINAFRDSLDVTTEKGRAAFLALTQCGDSLGYIYNQANALADLLDSAMSALEAAVDAEKQAAQDRYDIEIKRINDEKKLYQDSYSIQLKAAQDHNSALSKIAGTLKSTFDGLTAPDAGTLMSRQNAQAAIRGYVQSGGLPMNGELDAALKVAATNSPQLFSTLAEYQKDAAKTAMDIKILNDRAQGQLSVADLTLKALTDGNTARTEEFAKLEAEAKLTLDKETSRLDEIIKQAKRQVDIANGTYQATLSVSAALSNLNGILAGMAATSAAGTTGTAGTTPGPLQGAAAGGLSAASGMSYGQALAVTPNYDRMAAQASAQASMIYGLTQTGMPQAMAELMASQMFPAFAAGGITNGLSIAGEAGPEAIVPLPDGRSIPVKMNGAADNREIVEELKNLRQEVVQLRAQVGQGNVNTKKTADFMEINEAIGPKAARAA